MQRQNLHSQQNNRVSTVSSSRMPVVAATLPNSTENAHIEIINDPIITHVIPYLTNQGDDKKSIRDLRSAARSCHYFHNLFQPELMKQVFKKLLQAVIDDQVYVVKKILDKNPALVFAVTDKDLVIESRFYTWQRFNVKNTNALKIAAKRKQLGMVELLLSYCDKLPQTNAMQAEKANALSAWTPYQIERNAEGEEKIAIPPAYKDYMQSLVNAFAAETFPYGIGTPTDRDYTHLSDETEANLSFLFNLLLPKNAVPLDDEYVDVELLLHAAYKAYVDNFNAFHNWEQRDAFCIRVIGLTMTVLPPEMGAIFCAGLIYMDNSKNKKTSERPQSLMLPGGCDFYRYSRDFRFGVGFKYLCDGRGFAVGHRPNGGARPTSLAGKEFQTICRQRQEVFESYTASTASARPAHRAV